ALTSRPNVVIILADDLDNTFTPLWDVMPKSAALLRDKGMTFTNAFVDSPDCCPSRSSLLLGVYPHNDGVWTDKGAIGGWDAFHANNDEVKTFPLALHNSGYRTALIGKYLNHYTQSNAGLTPPPGWDDWNALIDDNIYSGYNYSIDNNGVLETHGNTATDYSTDVLADKTLQFLDDAAQTP